MDRFVQRIIGTILPDLVQGKVKVHLITGKRIMLLIQSGEWGKPKQCDDMEVLIWGEKKPHCMLLSSGVMGDGGMQ